MPIQVRDATAWRLASQLYVRDATAWRQVRQAWVHDGTAWRQTYVLATPVTPTGSGQTYTSIDQGSTQASLTIRADGGVTISAVGGGATGQWLTQVLSGAGGAYWVRMTGPTGAGYTNGAATWTRVSSDVQFAVSSVGTSSASGPDRTAAVLVEIAATSGGAVLASGTITLRAWGQRIN